MCYIKIQILSTFRKRYRTLHFDASKCRVTHRDRLDSRPPWFTVNISVSLFRFHIVLKGYKQFIFSTEITLSGSLWINFFSVLQLISPMRFFFSEKSCYSYTWDALVCICFMTFWHIFW